MDKALQAFGEKFLKYVLATTHLDADPTPQQRETISLLEDNIARLDQENIDGLNRYSTLQNFVAQTLQGGPSLANQMRLHCGGILPVVNDEDPLVANLVRFAIDVYPLLLISPPKDHTFPGKLSMAATFNHTNRHDFYTSVMRDELLSSIFAHSPESDHDNTSEQSHLGIQSDPLFFSNGKSGGIQLTSLPDSLLDYAWQICLAKGGAEIDEYLEEVRTTLGVARRIVEGKQAQVYTIVGLGGVRLEDNQSIDLSFGRLIAVQEAALEAIVRHRDLQQRTQAFLLVPTPLKIMGNISGDAEVDQFYKKNSDVFESHRGDLEYNILRTRLALLLASTDERLVASPVTFQTTLEPLTSSSGYSWLPIDFSGASVNISAETALRVKNWSNILKERHPKSLNIAARRLLSAVSTRFDATDALIDAVVAWENMFGSPQEATLRVTGAMAKILEQNSFDDRKKLKSRLGEIYAARSDLIHGSHGKEPTRSAIYTYRQEAIRYALDALRWLYDNPTLLKKNSADRSLSILLDAIEETGDSVTPLARGQD
ncbi:HEPN domain-containing protein [Nocardiopsis baichengensis]|uniref:HEPN domain-containing protein n=1 Tax=Nocardiopsis baichengensis TaxID=280240 RepID=UPI00034D26A0|nr:HEPN domain-containing protein [Nocardiopsis baichengensis]